MQNSNPKRTDSDESFIKIFLSTLSRIGNVLIIALALIFFGIKKAVFAFKKDKDEQTLYEFVKKLEEHLEVNSKNIGRARKTNNYYRPQKEKAPGKIYSPPKSKKTEDTKTPAKAEAVKAPGKAVDEKAYTPVYQRSSAEGRNSKYKKKKSRLLNIMGTMAAVSASAIIIFLIVVTAKWLIERKNVPYAQTQKSVKSVSEVAYASFTTDSNDFHSTLRRYRIDDSLAAMNKTQATTEPEAPLFMQSAPVTGECGDEPSPTEETATPEPAVTEETTPEPYATLDISQAQFSQDILIHEGDTNDQVPAIQERLMDLHYMDADEPTDKYGEMTSYAIQLFQRNHELMVDGVAGYSSLTLLFSEEAKPYMVRKGDYGFDIYVINNRLIELGYLSDDDSGKNFTEDTDYAVRVFQGRNKLSQDGIVGYNTTQVLFNGDAKPAKNYKTSDDGGSDSDGGGGSSDGGSYNANDASSFVAYAKAQMNKGYTYIWGGKGPPGMDCSGFVYYCLKQTGNGVGYMTSAAWAKSSYKSVSSIHDAKPGDILCFDGHVAICIGDGKMIDSSSSSNAIRIANYESSSYWNKKWICAKRVFS